MFLVSRVDLIAPLPRPLIQILPTTEGAPRQEVMLYKMKRSFDAPRTVRIPNRVRHEPKAETLSKGGHLRHRHHVASGAAQHYHVRVIDHDASGRATHESQRLREKHLTVETPEVGITLEEQHPRIAQHCRCGLHLALLAAQLELVGRRVVLNLFTGRERILARRRWRHVADSMS